MSPNDDLNSTARNTDDVGRLRHLVLAEGADLLSTNGAPWHHTALHQAAFHGRLGNAEVLVELLEQKGLLEQNLTLASNPCGRGAHGWPVELARGGGHDAIARLLEAKMGPLRVPGAGPPAPGGVWTEHRNIDMCGQGDVEIVPDWKAKMTIADLKRKVEQSGYSAFTVSSGNPSFGHAALKKFDFALTQAHCKPITTCCNHPCTIYIYTPPGGGPPRAAAAAAPASLRACESDLIESKWSGGKPGGGGEAYDANPWRFNADGTFVTERDGCHGVWALKEHGAGVVLRMDWRAGQQGNHAEFAWQGGEPLWKCTGSSYQFMRSWSIRLRGGPPAGAPTVRLDGHYFSFQTGGDPANVVDRFEARQQGDRVTYYRNGPVGSKARVDSATAKAMESYHISGSTLSGPVSAAVQPNGDIAYSHGYTSRREAPASEPAAPQMEVSSGPAGVLCRECSTGLPAHAKFCPSCGSKQACKKCGARLVKGANFCVDCGEQA